MLRAEGFTGSAGNYRLPSQSHWALISFQKSTASNRGAVKFTLNLKVVSYREYESLREEHPFYSAKPSPNVGLEGWTRRIGQLLPSGQDTWWTLQAGQPTANPADEVLAALRDHGLPALRAEL